MLRNWKARLLAGGLAVGLLVVGALIVLRRESATAAGGTGGGEPTPMPSRELGTAGANTGGGSQAPEGSTIITPITTPLMMKCRNQFVPVYPKNWARPYDDTRWQVQTPATITEVKYDSADRTLFVEVSFNWSDSDLEEFKDQLARQYAANNHSHILPKDLYVSMMPMAKYQLLMVFGGEDYLLKEFGLKEFGGGNILTTGTTAMFTVPMRPGMESLHKALSESPKAVDLKFRAFYPFEEVAGIDVRVAVLQTAAVRALEKVQTPGHDKPDTFYVRRDARKELFTALASEISVSVKAHGIAPAQQDQLITELKATAMSNLERLPPIDLMTIHEHANGYLVWTPTTGRVELQPIIDNKLILESRKAYESYTEVRQIAESVSDVASNKSLLIYQVHHEVGKIKGSHEGTVAWGLFLKIAGNWHLDKEWSNLNRVQMAEVEAARTYASNKTDFLNKCFVKAKEELIGELRQNKTIAKDLDLFVVSKSVLSGSSNSVATFERVLGRQVIAHDTINSLVVQAVKTDPLIKKEVIDALAKMIETNNSEVDKKLDTKLSAMRELAERADLGYETFEPTLNVGIPVGPDGVQVPGNGTEINHTWPKTFGNRVVAVWYNVINNNGNGFSKFGWIHPCASGNRVALRVSANGAGVTIQVRIHVLYEKDRPKKK